MASLRYRHIWALLTVLSMGCSEGAAPIDSDERDASVDSSFVEEPAPAKAEAREVVTRLDERLASVKKAAPLPHDLPIEPSPVAKARPLPVHLVREGAWLRARPKASEYPADVSLPTDARGAFRIIDKQTGLSVVVTLRDTKEAGAELVDGQAVYRDAMEGGGDLVHRPSGEGTEDFILFNEAPSGERLEYEVSLGDGVAGLRLVENALELLDEGGAPRIRVSPPYVIGADGDRHDAKLSVEDCAYDTNPAAPWGRELVAPGASSCTVRVAWDGRGVRYPAVVDPVWTTAKSMNAARYSHVAALLNTGKVLVTGGYNSTGYLMSAELYDPGTDTWSTTGSMHYARISATATLLKTGKVLVAGGYNSSHSYIGRGNLYDPAVGTWGSTSNDLLLPRYLHVAALLNDGSVLIIGGATGAPTNSVELYSPTNNTFSNTGWMSSARNYAQAVTLPSGKVLVSGGQPTNSTYLATAEIYDPATKTFSSASSFSGARAHHTMTLLATGKVLVYGGYNGSSYLGTSALYDPATNTWSAATDQGFSQYVHQAALLSDGRVLSTGGFTTTYLNRAVLYDPVTNTSASAPSMQIARAYHTVTRLGSGSVLVAGGYNGSYLNSAELFQAQIACNDASECDSGFCVDGYCCNSACGPCGQCNKVGFEGVCQAFVAGSAGNPSCAPYACNGSSASCPTSCTSNTQCSSDRFCSGNQCVPKLAKGSACSSAAQCQSGFCSDNVCCDAACSGACDVCSAALGASANGSCTNLPSSTTCNTNYLCSGMSGTCPTSCSTDANCATNAYCNANKQCVGKLANGGACTAANQCSSGFCVDGRCCNSGCGASCDRCDVSGWLGTCVVASSGTSGSPSCAPYLCNGASANCPSSCSNDSQCVSGSFCDGGKCVGKRARGETCTAGSQCTSGYCANGFCCDKACAGSCETCSAALGASSNGTCTTLASGAPQCGNYVCNGSSGTCPNTCSSDVNCAAGRYCTSSFAGACVSKLALGSSCSSNNQCQSGSCVDGVCCNTDCQGGCDRCNLAGSVGTCTVVSPGSLGANPSCGQYVCDGNSASCPTFCSTDANCVSSAACANGVCVAKAGLGGACSESRLCLSGFCADGVCCNAACDAGSCDRCDLPGSMGTCRVAPLGSEGSPVSCAPYVCNGVSGACPSSCTSEAHCAFGYACVGGICEKKKDDGMSCNAGSECASGSCVDGLCCDGACFGACERCDLEGQKGSCRPVPAKTEGKGCGAYLCNGQSSNCPSSCQDDSDCEDAYCYAGKCYAKAENGVACSSASECRSGFCVDGTCCESACDGQCARCDAKGALGICQAVKGNPVGKRPPCANDGSSCGGLCDGIEMSQCSYPSGETLCASAGCADGFATGEGRCDGEGACGFEKERCAPYACGASGCMTSCASEGDCGESASCVDGECKGTLTPGATCSVGGECESGFCVDGVCCESACTEACASCNSAGSAGTCVANAEPGCIDDSVPVWEGESDDSGPCGCRVAGEKRSDSGALALASLTAALAVVRRRRSDLSRCG